jgi:opacity protein-like surface antigen
MRAVACVVGLCAAAAVVPAPALAQDASRAKHWEFNVGTRYLNSESLAFDNTAKADVEGSWGFLMGFSYNFNNHLSLGGELSWSTLDYTGTITSAGAPGTPVNVRGTAYATSLGVNAVYHFLSGPVTPYLSGSVGAVYLDTGIPSGPPVTGCWWYPWYWGYVCGSVVPTKTSTDWTYGVGAGLRWDINEKFFLRAGVQQIWWTAGSAEGTPSFLGYRADFGFKF